jgi:deazaflavin-dependent oxidoreductase (nitroreductase family)
MARRIRRKGGGKFMGFNALVLTTVGHKSGLERTTPVGWFPGQDGSWLIVASANGAVGNPAWYYNIAARPRQDPDRGRRPQGSGGRRATPRGATRRGLAADPRRRAPFRPVSAQDRPGTADHPPDAPTRQLISRSPELTLQGWDLTIATG